MQGSPLHITDNNLYNESHESNHHSVAHDYDSGLLPLTDRLTYTHFARMPVITPALFPPRPFFHSRDFAKLPPIEYLPVSLTDGGRKYVCVDL